MIDLVIERYVNDSGDVSIERVNLGTMTLKDIFFTISQVDESGQCLQCWCGLDVYKAPEQHSRACQEIRRRWFA